jgi:hypothetical protein
MIENEVVMESRQYLLCPSCGTRGSIELGVDVRNTCQCGEHLRSDADDRNRIFYVGQSVQFLHRTTGIPYEGTVIKIIDRSLADEANGTTLIIRDQLLVRYLPPFNIPRYDEIRQTSQVADRNDEKDIECLVGTRKRSAPRMVDSSNDTCHSLYKKHKRQLAKVKLDRHNKIKVGKDCNSQCLVDLSIGDFNESSTLACSCNKTFKMRLWLLRHQENCNFLKKQSFKAKISERLEQNNSEFYEGNKSTLILLNLYDEIFLDEIFDIRKFMNCRKIIAYLQNQNQISPRRKTMDCLKALVALFPHCIQYTEQLIQYDSCGHFQSKKRMKPESRIIDVKASFNVTRTNSWVTDFLHEEISKSHPEQHEHDTCTFLPCKRLARLDCKIVTWKIDNLMRYVRFVEMCTTRHHCGISRLNRCLQRALCRYLYTNCQPKLCSSSRLRCLSADRSLSGCPITLSFIEKLLWCCPTTVNEISKLEDLERISAPTFYLTLEQKEELNFTINKFLHRRGVDGSELIEFMTVYECNRSKCAVLPLRPVNDVPAFCDLCKYEGQENRSTIEYSVENFIAMKPIWPLSFQHFRYVWRLVSEFYENSSFHGVLGVSVVESGQKTMYGEIHENLIEEIVQRSILSARDVFTDIGSGIGQVLNL